MSVIRVNKTENYSVISNLHFKEKNMSLKAKGLLSLMLSLPDNWDYSIAGLVSICKENETAIKSALAELKKFGYLKVSKIMPDITKNGRISYIYDIYEKPTKKQGVEKQGVENLPLEILPIENQGQLNTDTLNTKKSIIYNNKKINKKDFEIEFSELWKIYPRKIGKDKAVKSYVSARKNGVTFEMVKTGIEKYKDYVKGKDEKFIKHGSTWFNQKGWEDDYSTSIEEKKDEVAAYNLDLYEKMLNEME